MLAFLTEYGAEIILTLVTAGLIAFCKHLYKETQKYKDLLEEKDDAKVEAMVDHKMDLLRAELQELKILINAQKEKNEQQIQLLIQSYRYRLLTLCKHYIAQGHITPEQYEQLTEMYKVYHGFGGNGQAKEFYETALKLDIRED